MAYHPDDPNKAAFTPAGEAFLRKLLRRLLWLLAIPVIGYIVLIIAWLILQPKI